MKSERRHELQTNVLADWMGHQIDAVKPYWQVIVGVLVGAVLVVVVILVMNAPGSGDSTPWTSLFTAIQSPEKEDTLRAVITKNQGTTPGWYAKLALTDLEVQQGLRMLYVDQGEAKTVLEGALKDYQDVADNAGDASLRRRAEWGIAKTYEGLAGTWDKDDPKLKKNIATDLEKAVAAYRKLAEEDKDSAVGSEAEHNLRRLIGPDGKIRGSVIEVYTAIAAYEPNQQATPLDASALPEVPDLTFPGQFSIIPDEEPQGTPDSSTPDSSTPDSTTPDPSKPDDAKPDDAKPDDAKPEGGSPDASQPKSDPTSDTPGAKDTTEPKAPATDNSTPKNDGEAKPKEGDAASEGDAAAPKSQ
ncbi:MAG: hypothetical protein RIC55_30630 [Pirellulaceae bacterium]